MSPGTQSARYSSARTPGGKGGSSRFPEFPPPLTAHPLDRAGEPQVPGGALRVLPFGVDALPGPCPH